MGQTICEKRTPSEQTRVSRKSLAKLRQERVPNVKSNQAPLLFASSPGENSLRSRALQGRCPSTVVRPVQITSGVSIYRGRSSNQVHDIVPLVPRASRYSCPKAPAEWA